MIDTRDISIELMTKTFMQRLDDLVQLEEFDTTDAIYSEFIVDGKDPLDSDYEWTFFHTL
jgi:hypothetical protein